VKQEIHNRDRYFIQVFLFLVYVKSLLTSSQIPNQTNKEYKKRPMYILYIELMKVRSHISSLIWVTEAEGLQATIHVVHTWLADPQEPSEPRRRHLVPPAFSFMVMSGIHCLDFRTGNKLTLKGIVQRILSGVDTMLK
jgi:hypothetical protein